MISSLSFQDGLVVFISRSNLSGQALIDAGQAFYTMTLATQLKAYKTLREQGVHQGECMIPVLETGLRTSQDAQVILNLCLLFLLFNNQAIDFFSLLPQVFNTFNQIVVTGLQRGSLL